MYLSLLNTAWNRETYNTTKEEKTTERNIRITKNLEIIQMYAYTPHLGSEQPKGLNWIISKNPKVFGRARLFPGG